MHRPVIPGAGWAERARELEAMYEGPEALPLGRLTQTMQEAADEIAAALYRARADCSAVSLTLRPSTDARGIGYSVRHVPYVQVVGWGKVELGRGSTPPEEVEARSRAVEYRLVHRVAELIAQQDERPVEDYVADLAAIVEEQQRASAVASALLEADVKVKALAGDLYNKARLDRPVEAMGRTIQRLEGQAQDLRDYLAYRGCAVGTGWPEPLVPGVLATWEGLTRRSGWGAALETGDTREVVAVLPGPDGHTVWLQGSHASGLAGPLPAAWVSVVPAVCAVCGEDLGRAARPHTRMLCPLCQAEADKRKEA